MTKKLVRIALIAAMYAGLALLLKPISFGVVQFRLSESLVIMPLFMFEGVWGVTIGCMLANIASPFGIIDIVLGSAITLVSGLLTRVLRKSPLLQCFRQ
ncbi:MAG: QueT transporter family protein [Clostridia bacterium]